MSTTMNLRISPEIKAKAQALFAALGMDMTTAVNLFLRQAILKNGLPFEVKLPTPNEETLAALAEVEEMKKDPSTSKTYKDAASLFEEVLHEL